MASSHDTGRSSESKGTSYPSESSSGNLIPPASLLVEAPRPQHQPTAGVSLLGSQIQASRSAQGPVPARNLAPARTGTANPPPLPPRSAHRPVRTAAAHRQADSEPAAGSVPIPIPSRLPPPKVPEEAVFSDRLFTPPDRTSAVRPQGPFQSAYPSDYARDLIEAGYPDPPKKVQRNEFNVQSRPAVLRRPDDMTCYPPPSLGHFPANVVNTSPPPSAMVFEGFDLDPILDQTSRESAEYEKALAEQARVRDRSYAEAAKVHSDVSARKSSLEAFKDMHLDGITAQARCTIRQEERMIKELEIQAEKLAGKARDDEAALQEIIARASAPARDDLAFRKPLTSDELQVLDDAGLPRRRLNPLPLDPTFRQIDLRPRGGKGKQKEGEGDGQKEVLWKQWARAAGIPPESEK